MKNKLLLFLIGFLLFPSMALGDDSFEYNNVEYRVVEQTKTVVACGYILTIPNINLNIVIPEEVRSYKVIGISDNAFARCSWINSVEILNSVTKIGKSAFEGCTKLRKVKLGNSITSIGDYAFHGCTSLESIEIPNSVISIGYQAFTGCTALTSLTIGSAKTSIGDCAFWGCTGLKSVKLGNSITSIGSHAFLQCTGITSIEIPNSVPSIGDYAFSECTGLRSVKFGNSVEIIYGKAFYGCSRLENIEIPNSVKIICGSAFDGCIGLRSVKFGDSVEYINNYAFEGCRGLESIEIPNSVIEIGSHAFRWCTGLRSVKFGNSVTKIDGFEGCTGLTSIEIPNSVTFVSGFDGCTGLTSVKFGNSVTKIGGFEGCTGLTSIEIPNTVTLLYDHAFRNCTGLKKVTLAPKTKIEIGEASFMGCNSIEKIYCLSEQPHDYTHFFVDGFEDNVFSSAILYVPMGAKKKYNGESPWYRFRNINEINVEVPPEEISLSTDNVISITAGESFQIVAIVSPEDTSDKSVTWKSSNPQIVSVNTEGIITGISVGNAYVTAEDIMGHTSSVKVIVDKREVPATNITIQPSPQQELKIGEQLQLTAIITPQDATDKTVKWSSSDPNIVSVGQTGLITANKEGFAVVTAVCGSVSDSCEVTVTENHPEEELRIILNTYETKINKGEYIELKATLYPLQETYKNFDWYSVESGITSIQRDNLDGGEAKIFGIKEGKDTIIVRAGELSASCQITVIDDRTVIEAEKIDLMFVSIPMKVGESVQNYAYIYPEETTNKTVKWSSSDPDIVSVGQTGLITAIKEGFAVVTAVCGSVSASCEVTVTENHPEEELRIFLNTYETKINLGEYIELKATLYPLQEAYKNFDWYSVESGITSIQGDNLDGGEAKIFGIKEGKDTIIVRAGELSASCQVTVIDDRTVIEAEEIDLMFVSIPMIVGESVQNYAYIYPEETTNKTVKWSSSDPDIASVDQTGLITAIKEGFAVVTAVCGSVYAICEITITDGTEAPPISNIIWNQEFQCGIGDIIQLDVRSTDGTDIICCASRPDGGYVDINVFQENGDWYAHCHSEGTVMIQAWRKNSPNEKISKTFNVVKAPEELIYHDGLYFRFIDNSKTSLKVCRGFTPYEGDYTIPANVMGYEVIEVEEYAFYTCKNLGKVFIEYGIKKIGSQSFGNGSIYEIHIPSSINRIQDWAFNANSPSFNDIYLYGLTPVQVNETIFNGYVDYERCVLHIPFGTYELYRDANIWSNFLNIVEDIQHIKAENIQITPNSLTLNKGLEYQLIATLYPENVTENTILWETDNKKVATVSKNGLVKAIKIGKARITASCGDVSVVCNVVVNDINGVRYIINEDEQINVYTVNGVLIKEGILGKDLDNLEPGLYIIHTTRGSFKIQK